MDLSSALFTVAALVGVAFVASLWAVITKRVRVKLKAPGCAFEIDPSPQDDSDAK